MLGEKMKLRAAFGPVAPVLDYRRDHVGAGHRHFRFGLWKNDRNIPADEFVNR